MAEITEKTANYLAQTALRLIAMADALHGEGLKEVADAVQHAANLLGVGASELHEHLAAREQATVKERYVIPDDSI